MHNIPRDLTAGEIRNMAGDSPVMLEIGSHEGADTVKFLAAMPGVRLYCFEPDQRPITRFKQLIGENDRVSLCEKAVADVDGPLQFFASTGPAGDREDWDFSGSLQEPTGHYQRSPEIKFKPPSPVPCVRLDTWLGDNPHIHAIDFIWCDPQGSQRRIIAGGKRALSITRYLYIECHYPTPAYDGEPTRDELIDEMNGALNFEPLGIYATDNILFRNRSLV